MPRHSKAPKVGQVTRVPVCSLKADSYQPPATASIGFQLPSTGFQQLAASPDRLQIDRQLPSALKPRFRTVARLGSFKETNGTNGCQNAAAVPPKADLQPASNKDNYYDDPGSPSSPKCDAHNPISPLRRKSYLGCLALRPSLPRQSPPPSPTIASRGRPAEPIHRRHVIRSQRLCSRCHAMRPACRGSDACSAEFDVLQIKTVKVPQKKNRCAWQSLRGKSALGLYSCRPAMITSAHQ